MKKLSSCWKKICNHNGSVALLLYFDKVLALSKFTLLKCEIEVNPIAQILRATCTAQIEIAQCWTLPQSPEAI